MPQEKKSMCGKGLQPNPPSPMWTWGANPIRRQNRFPLCSSFMRSVISSRDVLRDRPQTRASILIVDDSHEDKYFLLWALKTLDLNNPIHVLSSGEEAISYLSSKPPFEDRMRFPIPHLMLLDLKMPNVDGFEVLQWLKTQPALDGLHVVVFSGSNRESDIAKAKQLGAEDYIVKPSDTLDLVHVLREVTFKWLS